MRRAALLLLTLLASASASAADGKRIRLAVMPFESASSDADLAALGKGLQAMITTDLNEVGEYDLVERSRLTDIQAELSLTKTGAIDKTTAAKIGKLAGASHLLTGTVTVMGEQMRIDARIFATETGAILLSEKIEGAKNEFFDLEKAIVKKLVGVTGVTMSPKVRVKVDKVQTADFKAFKTFSDGLDAFDRKDYQQSVQLMRKAAEIDPDFNLATLTMEQYEKEITSMKTRSINVDIDKRRQAEIDQSEDAKKEVALLEPFWTAAKKTGKSPADVLARLWGLYNLFDLYDASYTKLPALHNIEDRFELERTADALAAAYFAEAQSVFPRVPIIPQHVHNWEWDREPDSDRKKEQYKENAYSVRKQWDHMCRRLLLDDKRCGDMMLSVAEKMKKGADKEDLAKMVIEAANVYRHAGEPDASTIAFSAAQKISTDSYTLKTLVQEVEANRDVKALWAKCKSPYVREYMLLDGWRAEWKGDCNSNGFEGLKDPPNLDGARKLTRERSVPEKGAILVDDHPTWVFGSRDVSTGARKTASSTDSIVYYEAKERKQPGVLSVIDGRKTDNLSFGLEVSWTPPVTWYPPEGYQPRKDQTVAEYEKGRPRVVVVFGMVDVDVQTSDDPVSGNRRITRPTRAYGVMLDNGEVSLVELNEDPGDRVIRRTNNAHELKLAWKKMGVKSLASKKSGAAAKGTVPVKLEVNGKSVKVNVGGDTMSFELPKAQKGYYGVWIDGGGYAHFGKLKIQ